MSISGFSDLFALANVLILRDISSLIMLPSAPDFTNIKISPFGVVFKICSTLFTDPIFQSIIGFGSYKIFTLNSSTPGISSSLYVNLDNFVK